MGQLAEMVTKMANDQYFIESSEVDRKLGICRVRGWAAYTKPLKVYLENSRGNRIPCEIQHLKRVDVQNQYPEAEVGEKCGFFFELHYQQLKEFYIVFEAGSIRVRRQIHLQPVQLAAEKMNEYCSKEKNIRVESSSQGSVNDLETSVLAAAEGKVGAEKLPNIVSSYADTAFKAPQRAT